MIFLRIECVDYCLFAGWMGGLCIDGGWLYEIYLIYLHKEYVKWKSLKGIEAKPNHKPNRNSLYIH